MFWLFFVLQQLCIKETDSNLIKEEAADRYKGENPGISFFFFNQFPDHRFLSFRFMALLLQVVADPGSNPDLLEEIVKRQRNASSLILLHRRCHVKLTSYPTSRLHSQMTFEFCSVP